MTRKFLFCFPLRAGNIVFGFIIIVIGMAVLLYNLFLLACTFVDDDQNSQYERFSNWDHLEEIFGQKKTALVALVTRLYYASYITISTLYTLAATLLLIGVYKVNQCMVSTFFVYSFFHIFLTIGLLVWEITSNGYIQIGLIIAFDVMLLVCLFGVRYLMEAIRVGHVYSQPGEVLYRY